MTSRFPARSAPGGDGFHGHAPRLLLARVPAHRRQGAHGETEAGEREDALRRDTVRADGGGVQRLVPADDLAHRALQRLRVGRAGEAQETGDAVRGRVWRQALQQPRPYLPERERRVVAARLRNERRAGDRAAGAGCAGEIISGH
jgi:hypothetical protein